MSSQKSTAAVEPKRARGRARVEAILAAASRVFAEQGYDRATMTEIAARSSTAIGSLYRFFPTKETLGEALLERFHEAFATAFDDVADRAAGLGARALADALVQAFRGSTSEELRAGVMAVLEGRGDEDQVRRDFRARRRKQLVRILRIASPSLDPAEAQARAAVIVYLLKGEDAIAQEEPTVGKRVAAEVRRLLAHYVGDAIK